MPIYNIKCQDGADSQCYRTIEVDIPIKGLDKLQLNDLIESGRTQLTRDQVTLSNLDLSPSQEDELREEENLLFEQELDSVCDSCGSDQVYDDGGKNITAE